MATKNKTVETKASVDSYLKKIKNVERRKDVAALIDLIKKNIKLDPKMWGTSIVGFGSYHYKYESGREGDAPLTGIASRANAITIYFCDFEKKEELFSKLGKYKTEGGCLYIKQLKDVDLNVLAKIIKRSFEEKKRQSPGSK